MATDDAPSLQSEKRTAKAVAVEEVTKPSHSGEAPDGLTKVIQAYHKRIGTLGPIQFEKLTFWFEEMGMSPELGVVACDIAELKTKRPSIGYVEGYLRNWSNLGVTTYDELIEKCQGDVEQLIEAGYKGYKLSDKKPAASPSGPNNQGVDGNELAQKHKDVLKFLYGDDVPDDTALPV